MPELPEVETIRRQLAPRLAGRRITSATAHPSPKFSPAGQAAGRRIEAVDRRGKYLLLRLEGDTELVVHLGMTGRLELHGTPPPDDPYDRATWHLDDGGALRLHDVRRFGRVAVVPRGHHRALPTLAALGPEPLGPGFTPTGLWRSLRSSRRAVKTQILSQRPVAGVGNIYADEALWLARVHPGSTAVGRAAAGRLHGAIVEVLQEGLAHGGTTLRDYADLDGAAGGHQHHLRCYGRGGSPCERCGRPLRSNVLDARGTTWCPGCQHRRGRPARRGASGSTPPGRSEG